MDMFILLVMEVVEAVAGIDLIRFGASSWNINWLSSLKCLVHLFEAVSTNAMFHT